MRTNIRATVIALIALVVFPVLAFAQGGDPTPDRPWYYTTTGIAGATIVVVSGLKRILGNVDGANKVPTWLYAVAVSCGLTALAAYGLKTLTVEVSAVDLFWQAAMSAASATGAYEWFNNSTKTLKASARSAGVRITDQH